MRWLWTSVSAIAVLAYAGAASADSSVGVLPAPGSARAVTIEVADAGMSRAGDLYVSLANPTTARFFAYADEGVSLSGHMLNAPPAALSLDTAPHVSLGDVAVTRSIAPGVALDFAYGNTGVADPYNLGMGSASAIADPALSAPFASLANGGAYGGMRLSLGDVRFRFGLASRSALNVGPNAALSPVPSALFAAAGDGMRAQTLSASADWRFADWGGIAVTATQATERGTILGRSVAGPIAISNGASTRALGISARVGFGDGWVTTVAFDAGVTQLDLRPGWLSESMQSQSYGIALAKEGLFGDDMLGFSVSRPLQSDGVMFGNSAFGPRTRLSLSQFVGAPNAAPETDLQMGYVTTFLDGSLALQANAAYQMNANGERGESAVTASARAALKF